MTDKRYTNQAERMLMQYFTGDLHKTVWRREEEIETRTGGDGNALGVRVQTSRKPNSPQESIIIKRESDEFLNDAQSRLHKMEDYVRSLNHRALIVLIYRYRHYKKWREIGELLNCHEDTVRKAANKVIDDLARKIQGKNTESAR